MLDLTIFAGQEDQCGSRSSLSLPALCKGGECSWPFHGDGDLNSGLPACTESTLPTEPSQSPSKALLIHVVLSYPGSFSHLPSSPFLSFSMTSFLFIVSWSLLPKMSLNFWTVPQVPSNQNCMLRLTSLLSFVLSSEIWGHSFMVIR